MNGGFKGLQLPVGDLGLSDLVVMTTVPIGELFPSEGSEFVECSCLLGVFLGQHLLLLLSPFPI